MYDKTVWSPKPCVNCLCSSGEVVCDRILCPALRCQLKFQPIGECCPICIDPGLEKQLKLHQSMALELPVYFIEIMMFDFSLSYELKIVTFSVVDAPEFSGDPPSPNDLDDPYTEISQSQKDKKERLKKDEEEQIHKKDAERKQRKKQKKEEAERQRKLKEAKEAREKEEELRRLREEEEERAAAEERKRRMEEQRRVEEDRARRLEMEQREMMRALEEAAERAQEGLRGDETTEDEDMVWLRGDVFQMPPVPPMRAADPPPLLALQEPTEPGEEDHEPGEASPEEKDVVEEESEMVTTLLPPGCSISDVTVTCENAKLMGIPPLSIPELKSLSLQGEEGRIPA